MTSMRGRFRLLVRRTKRLIESWIYEIFDRIALCRAPAVYPSGIAAVVHVGLVGDYVLWRPYGRALIAWLRQNGFRLVLVIESGVNELARQDFPGCEVINVSRRHLLRDPRYRWRILRSLRSIGPTHSYVPRCPRDSSVHDALVRALRAPATGFDASFTDDMTAMSARSRRLYTCLVATPPRAHVDDQHRAFLANLGLDPTTEPVTRPGRPGAAANLHYWVMAPGASQDKRRWPAPRFVKIAQILAHESPPLACVILGAPDERPLCDDIAAGLQDRCINLAGQTSLCEMQQWIAHAQFLLGNDSAAGHMAAAMGVPAVIVTGGGHHGRCFPYTARHTPARRRPVAVAEWMPCFHCDWVCQFASAADAPYPCIERIDVGRVHAALCEARCERPGELSTAG